MATTHFNLSAKSVIPLVIVVSRTRTRSFNTRIRSRLLARDLRGERLGVGRRKTTHTVLADVRSRLAALGDLAMQKGNDPSLTLEVRPLDRRDQDPVGQERRAQLREERFDLAP